MTGGGGPYAVREIFRTLQGEGAQAGRPAVFCRFAGCNLWSGRERDRGRAICRFCDTEFIGTDGPGGGSFDTADRLADAVAACWTGTPAIQSTPMVVCTGGEPLLQLDTVLIEAFHSRGFFIAVETNGTLTPPAGIDWLCVSPKADAELAVDSADELKLVYPQAGAAPERYRKFRAMRRFLQPMDGPDRTANTAAAVAYCMRFPEWQLSLQCHKLVGLP